MGMHIFSSPPSRGEMRDSDESSTRPPSVHRLVRLVYFPPSEPPFRALPSAYQLSHRQNLSSPQTYKSRTYDLKSHNDEDTSL